MTYVNTNDSYGSFVKYSGSASTYTYSYNTLSLNSSVSDQDQLIVIRKFTPSSTFEAAAAPDGLGGTKIAASEQWEAWTLPNTSTSGSSMYTIDSVNKTITMSSTASDYAWDRDGTTVNLPAFDPSTDTIIIARKTYGVAPFVTWSSGSKLTSSQLNHQTTQLIYLTQELLDKVYYASDLDPYYGTPSGYATLDTSGIMAQGETNTITAGDGLSGGGTVGSNPTLAVDLATDSGLEFFANQLRVKTNTTVQRGSSGLDVITKGNGGLLSDSDGVYVDLEDSVTSTSTAKALTANQGKILKGLIDAQGTGVTYLGSVAPGVKATATFTFSDKPNEGSTITLTDADGTAIVFEIDNENNGASGSNVAVNGIAAAGGGATGTAADLVAKINAQGTLDIVATNPATGQVSLVAGSAGAGGNTAIAVNDSSHWNSNTSVNVPSAFTGGITQSSFPTTPGGRVFAAGDTVDTITRSGFVTPTGGTAIEVTLGEDLRYNASSAWYNAGATATLDDTSYFKTDGSRTATGEFNLGSNKITALATPTGNTDAATKAYVDTGWFTGTPAANHILKYSGSAWVSGTIGMEHLGNENISATPSHGDIIAWDYTNSKWTNSSIVSTPQIWYTGGAGDNAITGNADGSNLTFVVGVTPNSTINTAWLITVDGIIQPANKYSISGTTVTFSAGNAPPDEAELYFVCFGASVVTTLTSTVGNLSATSVTTTGDITVGGSITATGNVNLTKNLTVTNDSGVGTFTVAVDTGTTIINQDKFTVDGATGNTTIAGTLNRASGKGRRRSICNIYQSIYVAPFSNQAKYLTGAWQTTGVRFEVPVADVEVGDKLYFDTTIDNLGSGADARTIMVFGTIGKNIEQTGVRGVNAFTTATPDEDHNIARFGTDDHPEEAKLRSATDTLDEKYWMVQYIEHYRYHGKMSYPLKGMYTITQEDIDSNGSGNGIIYFDILASDNGNKLYYYDIDKISITNTFAFLLG